jgi:hypothetical protein
MESLINLVGQRSPHSLMLRDLEDRKDDLAAAIRSYQAVRLSAPKLDGMDRDFEKAEENLVEAWRAVIDLEGQLAGYKPLKAHHN